MYRKIKPRKTNISQDKSYTGETIEAKVRRILSNKEPIKDGAPIIYTERKEGVLPSYNIRTDRFDIAVEAMDKVNKSHVAKREERAKVVEMKKKEENTGGESIQGTDGK